MVRRLLTWSDEVCEKSIENDSDVKCYVKHAALGALEGFINGCVVYGAVGAGIIIYEAVKGAIKK